MLAMVLGRISNTRSEIRGNSKFEVGVERFEYNDSVVEAIKPKSCEILGHNIIRSWGCVIESPKVNMCYNFKLKFSCYVTCI